MSGQDFAVVDLETTGTQRGVGNRIIQFGCAIVHERQITEHISLTLNPQREVPVEILQLTQLDPKALLRAPTFKEVATTLQQLLKNKIFVAHNVNFDLPFLNEAFQEIGLPPLQVTAIDTVELAQIMLPQAASYRLQDLSGYLNITHKHPHQADSDAIATAKILLLLLKRIDQVPGVVLGQLSHLGGYLSRETGTVFSRAYQHRRDQALPAHLIQVGDLVLRRPAAVTPAHEWLGHDDYPETFMAKMQQWGRLLRPRQSQFKMMDFIQQHRHNPAGRPLVIEAPTGIGKSLGYLLPLSYQLSSAAMTTTRLVITTSTTVLQNQLYRQAIPLLNDLRQPHFSAAILKSSSHYVDLDRFTTYLRQGQQNRGTVVNEMRLLIWLTQTRTGDLDELQMTNYDTAFFQGINHLPQLVASSIYAKVDFWRRICDQAATADITITNNAYLAQHLSEFAPEQTMLVIDEAQHFADDLTNSSHHYFSVMRLVSWARQATELLHTLIDNNEVEPTLEQSYLWLTEIRSLLAQFQQELLTLNDCILMLAHENYITRPIYLDLATVPEERTALTTVLRQVSHALDQYLEASFSLETNFNASQMQSNTRQKVNDWQRLNTKLERGLDQLEDAQTHLQDQSFSEFGFYLDLDDDGINYRFNWLARSHRTIRLALDQQFPQQIYTGASLAVGTSFTYFLKQLRYQRDQLDLLQLPSPFDYGRKAELVTPATTFSPSENGADYDHWLVAVILPILRKTSVQTLILFNSLASVKNVYYPLQRALGGKREIMAQGITGSNDKIAKRFRFTNNGILLGSQSFWEGVDFPGQQLSLLIITRIPFESPKNPLTNYRQHRLASSGQGQPFWDDALPRAVLKLKQGFGRLIRSEEDHGLVLVLDERINQSSYAGIIQQAFPAQLPRVQLANSLLADHIHDFLQ
ncbi:helicase C-terminal domain-containing protein [Lapidilactobacillus luobeiensis]|uniref:helicase C-terminal domain-containing protein n=1 Tax=Lapidilactobacillus luobeiensis TaxID=2950371 RepID=UPI0021C43A10|nr:helicase C-terminal domain-containing protein [Lapidilactobacillus luobeiensis]